MTDHQLRSAARRLRADVSETIELDAAHENTELTPSAGRSRAGIAVVVVAVLAMVGGVFALTPRGGDVEVAVEETTSTTEPDPTVPDAVIAPTPIALGAPDDGKESVGLPVTAEPSTGLVDGQTVSVTGTGFPPGEAVGVVMCTREAGADHGGRGVDACNIGHFVQGTADQQGAVTVDFPVRRLATLDGEEIDCASETGRCILGMGMLSDYDQSGGVAIDFDPSEPLPDPPAVSLAKTAGIVDGESVAASITGLLPNSYLFVQQCAVPSLRCAPVGELNADADGNFDGDIRLWRSFGTYFDPASGARSPNVDCATEDCELQIQAETPGSRQIPPVGLGFDPSRGARVAPTFELTEPGPFHSGDTVTLTAEGLAVDTYIDASVCPSTGTDAGCFAWTGGQYDGGGTIDLQIFVETQGIEDPCAAGCVLVLSLYQQSLTGGIHQGPPPLFPEPVPISIAP
ncbi:MAG: neocarzinostatin apoprotein domain-containing protein [Acidimicrobiales bacterium]